MIATGATRFFYLIPTASRGAGELRKYGDVDQEEEEVVGYGGGRGLLVALALVPEITRALWEEEGINAGRRGEGGQAHEARKKLHSLDAEQLISHPVPRLASSGWPS